MGDTHESPFRNEVVEDKPTRGMWHCGPNPSWVTVTHLPTMVQARAYHRSQHKAREIALACAEMMLADAGVENEICRFPEALDTPAPPTPAEPAPMDREALVRLLQIITRNGSLDDGRTLHEVIADALLASGLRLPAPADPYAALSQHLHGDGDTLTAGGRLIVSAAEAAVSAWRTRALAAEAEVERLRAIAESIVEEWDWWTFDEYDRDRRGLAKSIADARAALAEGGKDEG